MKQNLKKVVALLMAVLVCIGSVSWNALETEAATIKYSGTDGDLNWSIDSDGHLLVEGTGDRDNPGGGYPAWNKHASEIKSATINVSEITNLYGFFAGCYYLTTLDLSNFDTSYATSMELMFFCCESLDELDLSNFDTTNVTNMCGMFAGCLLFTQLDLSSFDTQNVTNMAGMFEGCESLENLNLSNFNTENVTNMYGMFNACDSLRELDLSHFDTSNVTDMGYMFDGCDNLTNIKTPKNLNLSVALPNGMEYVWYDSQSNTYTELPKNLEYSIQLKYGEMPTILYPGTDGDLNWSIDSDGHLLVEGTGDYNTCPWLQYKTSIKTATVNVTEITKLSGFFYGCSNLTSVDLSNLDMAKVTSAAEMLERCDNLMTIRTPKNNNSSSNARLHVNNKGYFADALGTFYDELPLNQSSSITLTRINGVNSKQPDGGDGSQETPYEINEASELMWFAETVNAGSNSIHAVLTADIDLNPGYTFANDGTYTKSSEARFLTYWIPIAMSTSGFESMYYCGTFDGQNHVIKGIYGDSNHYSQTEYPSSYGLFGRCDASSEIKNLQTENSFIRGVGCVGLICGMSSGIISNCYNEGTVYGGSEAGGICGGSLGEIVNCYNKGAIYGSDGVGGICGGIWSGEMSIKNCYNIGSVSGSETGDMILGVIYDADVVLSNNYYLADSETDAFDGTTYKTAGQFSSGEVAYFLQAAQTGTEIVWGQLIGEEAYPVLEGTKVYNVENCKGGQYSNLSESKAHNMIDKACVVCGEGQNVDLSGYTISLKGNIAVNFYIQLSEKVLSDSSAYMLFTFADGDTSKVRVSDAEIKTDESNTYYVLTCEVQAPEINDEFTAQVITTACETEVYTYSVKKIC